MTTDTTSYEQYEKKKSAPTQDKLSQLARLADQQREWEVKIAKIEEELDEAKKKLASISEGVLPGLMDELELEEFKTKSGLVIKVGEHVRASISKERAEEAFQWLDDNGFSKLIKRTFTILFGKDEEKWANKFEGDLKKRKRQLAVKRKKEVHNQTLVAFVKERLTEGQEIPLELFGVFRQRYTKVEINGGQSQAI